MVGTSLSLDTERLSRLISLGYESPVGSGGDELSREREAWRAFANEAADVFQCPLATVEFNDPGNAGRSFIATGGLDGFEEVFSSARALNFDDNYLTGMRRIPQGAVLLGTDIVTPEEMRRQSSYFTLAMPWQLEHFLIGSILTREGAGAYFALGRTVREPAFVPDDKEILSRLLLTHLTRSMTLHTEVAKMRGTNAMLAAVLHQAPTGVIVFNAQGVPVVVNQKAAAIIASADGLHLTDGKLHADDALTQAQLDQALLDVLQFAQGRIVGAPPAVVVSRRSSRQPYRVIFSTLGPLGASAGYPRGSTAMAIIHEERRSGSANVPAALRATYGLTRAEVRLCQALLESRSLLEAADALKVSRNTAKTHLARIFDKTGVRSQVALLRLLTVGGHH